MYIFIYAGFIWTFNSKKILFLSIFKIDFKYLQNDLEQRFNNVSRDLYFTILMKPKASVRNEIARRPLNIRHNKHCN